MTADVKTVTSIKYPPELQDFEGWTTYKKILVILAHPDDPEFFCGAMLSRWAAIGHEIHYCLLTTGQKGSQDINQDPAELSELRKVEQQNAANQIGVKSVEFMDYVDGEVEPDMDMRRKIVRTIRRHRPQIVLTSDPLNYYPTDNRVNHPDHRAAGRAVLDASFPAAGNPQFFPELIRDENLPPVNIEELWFSIPAEANLVVDVSAYFDAKIDAILCHRSQVDADTEKFREMMKTRWVDAEEDGHRIYLERFRRIVFS
jgi:LmbE family N-acetylglucosaminyl deacetylase